MIKREYDVVRGATKTLQVLGDVDAEDVSPLTELYLEADREHSITKLFEALRWSFRKDLDAEKL